jgi:hypothetical protein
MPWRVRLGTIIFAFMAGVGVLRADWTAVASTGTIDESDLAKIALNTDGSAEIRSTIASTSAKIRYNVVAIPDLERLADPNLIRGGLIFSMRVRDNGTGAHVIATLRRITLAGFSITTPQTNSIVATIDSDLAPPSDGWQTIWAQHATCCLGPDGLNFLDNGYVVDVQLIKNHAGGTPAIMGVQLFRDET